MGADLITFLPVGPAKLKASKKRQEVAVRRAKKIISELNELAALREAYEGEDDPKKRKAISLKASKIGVAQKGVPTSAAKNFFSLKLSSTGSEFLDDNIWITSLDPEKVLEDFLHIWHHRSHCRDCSSRLLPNDPKTQVMVVGEMSWGDEPDGWGFQTVKAAIALGYLEFFGIG